MKKTWLILLLVLSVLFPVCRVYATDYSSQYVWDTAGILTDSQAEQLQTHAKEIADTYHCGTYIVTVNDYRDYNSSGPFAAAQSIYKDMNFGYGSGKDGEMLMLSMDDRDFAILAYGDFGNAAFTDYGKEKLDEVYLDNFRNNDWFGGFSDYLTQSEKYLDLAAKGTPFDVDSDPDKIAADRIFGLSVSFGIGAVLSAIMCAVFRAKMKSASIAGDADVYTIPGSARIVIRRDNFERKSVSRRRIQRSSGGGGGGGHSGGTSVNSGGFSGHSGKF